MKPSLLLIFVLLLFQTHCTTPVVYGMISDSTITYDNSTIASYNTSIRVIFPYTFKTIPQFAYTFADYKDYSNDYRIHYAIKTDSSTTLSGSIIRFAYASEDGKYPVTLRIRYLGWDKNIYNTIQTMSYSFLINNGVPTASTNIAYKESFTTVPKIHCFNRALINFSPQPNTAILLSCSTLHINNTHFQASVQTSHKNYNVSNERTYTVGYLVIFQSPKYSILDGSLISTGGSLAFHSYAVDEPNSHYLIGSNNYYKLGRFIETMLLDDDKKIDNSFTYNGLSYSYFIIKLIGDSSGIYLSQVTTFTYKRAIYLQYESVQHPDNKSINNFKVSNNQISIKDVSQKSGNSMVLQLQSTLNRLSSKKPFDVKYTWDHGVEYVLTHQVVAGRVAEIMMDVLSNSVQLIVLNFPESQTITANDYEIDGTNGENSFFADSQKIAINVSLSDFNKQQYQLQLTTSQNYKIISMMKMLRIKQVQVIIKQQKAKIVVEGFQQPASQLQQYFSTPIMNLSHLQTSQDNVTLTIKGRLEELLTGVDIGYTSPDTHHLFKIINTKIFTISVKKIQSTGFNNFKIQFQNPFNQFIKFQQISCSPDFVVPISLEIDPVTNNIIVQASFRETIQGRLISFIYQYQNSSYKQIVTVPIVSDIPLIYWGASDLKLYKFNAKMAEILQYVYLSIFFLSLITTKMPGIQTIYLIQLVFYTFIPIGVYRSSSFMGFIPMRYVSGWNSFFQDRSTSPLSNNYSLLQFNSNFLSNVNLMVGIILICPIVYVLLHVLSQVNNDYKFRPRLQKWSKSFLLEIPFTLFMFNCFNISISFVIHIQQIGTQDPLSLALSIVNVTMIPVLLIFLMVFQKQFSEFNQQINKTKIIFNMTQTSSTRLRMIYPFVLALEMILIPFLLSIQQLFSYGLFASLGVIIAASVYAIIARPYCTILDNIRLLIHRLLILIIICFQVFAQQAVTQSDSETFRSIYPLIIIALLAIGGILNVSYIVWKTYLWIRKPGIIDMKLFIQQKGTTNKLPVDYVPAPEGPSFPKLEYGLGFLNKRRRDRHVKLLDSPNESVRGRMLKKLRIDIDIHCNQLTEGIVINEQ